MNSNFRIPPGLLIVCSLAIYVEVLLYAHANYVGPLYYYLGIPSVSLSLGEHIWLIGVICLCSLLLPRKNQAFSSVLSWLLFVFCYVTSMALPAATGTLRPEILLELQISLTVGMALILILPQGAGPAIKPIGMSDANFWILLLLLFLALISWIIGANYGQMGFASMDQVYEQRSSAGSTVGLSAYALGIVSGSVDQFLMAYGILKRRPIPIVLGAFGQIIVYMVLAQKFVFLSLLYVPGLYFLFGGTRLSLNATDIPLWRTIFLAIGLLVVGCIFLELADYWQNQTLLDVGTLVVMRQFSLPGGLVAAWTAFFE